jgi:hypothetical protein
MSESPFRRSRQARSLPASPDSVRAFLKEVLQQIAAAARLLGVFDAPTDHYTLRIGMPAGSPRSLILAKHLVDQARTNATALRALRSTLKAEVGPLSSSLNVARGYRGTRIPPDTPCAVCAQPIREYERPVVRQARILHSRCAIR